MSFLDRFKPQPRWKHTDPAIRASAVAEVPPDEEHRAVLLELAADDPDARVRRAAIARLRSAAELVGLVRSEREEDLRRELAERLVSIAVAPADSDGEAALALEGLEDQRHLATVAKASPHDNVRTAALGRVHDTRTLGNVARGAVHAETALEAVARIADGSELANVAVRTDHKEAGLAALERAAAAAGEAGELLDLLETVAARAKNKSIAKRARAMMQAIQEAEAARRLALDAWQQKVAGLVARVEALAATPGGPHTEDALAEIEADWSNVGTDPAFELEPDSRARYISALHEARLAAAEYQRLEQARREADERQATLRSAREALVARVDSYGGDEAPEEVDRARAEWDALGSGDEEAAAGDRARFDAACTGALRRHQNSLERHLTHARLAELAAEAERLASDEQLTSGAWETVTAEWTTLLERSRDLDGSVVEQYERAAGRVLQREEEKREAEARGVRQRVQRIEQLIERATTRSTAEDLTLKEADRLVRDLRGAADPPLPLPHEEQRALMEQLQAATAAVTPRLHDLREMDEWKRFANAAVQEELIARSEALRVKYGFDTAEGPKEEEDLDKVARELHDIQERWKSVAEAPRAQAQALWHRYRQAADPVQNRLREFFARRNEERKGHLAKKLDLIARAEALADSTDWIRTADELKKLQAEWQQVGPVPRHETRGTWKQFRDACDRFFSRRNADLAERKETWSANLARKEALCARAEELAASKEWDKAASEIRRLQVEWKAIGPVRRNKSDAVWHRFRSACDTFFERYKRRDEIELESKQADREQLVAELEALGPADGTAGEGADRTALLEQVRSLRNRWNQSTPVVRHGADPLSARFVAALERTLAAHPDAFRGTELDVEPNRQKMEKLIARVEEFLKESAPAPANSSQALATMLREALAANTIGGRAGDEGKWRAMAEDVRQAQASWSRLGPVPGDAGRALNERFHRATSRFFDMYRRKVPPAQSAARGPRPVGTR